MSWRVVTVLTLSLVCGSAAAAPGSLSQAMEATLSSTENGGLARQFYQLRNGALAWNGGASAESKLAIAVLSNAAGEGLDPDRYRVVPKYGNIAANDVAISVAVLRYMRDLAVGRPEWRML